MDKLKYIRLENEDGSYSDSIPLAVDSDYVDVNGNTLTNELANKVTKTELNSNISNLQSQISSLASGSPLVASSTSEMTETDRIYVNIMNGYWYYYNGSSWVQGGVYQASSVNPDDAIISEINNNIDNLNGCFNINIGKNKFDGLKRVGGYNTTTGEYDSSNTNIQCNTNPVIVTPNTVYYISDDGSAKNAQVFLYQADGTFIEWIGAVNNFITPSNCGLVNFYAGTLSDKIMISETVDLEYESYKKAYELKVFSGNCYDKIIGKNKFDGLIRVGGYSTTTGAYDGSNQGIICNVNPVKVNPSTKYYVSNNGVAIGVIQFFYDINGDFINWGAGANNFTTPDNCYYLNFYSGSVSDKTMISESNDLTYEAYKNVYLSNTNPNNNVLTYISQNIAEMVLENCFDYEAQKNKFDGLTRVGGYNISTGEYDASNTSASCNTNPVKVKENTKYYVSDNGSAKNAVIFYYRSDGTYISYSGGTNNFTTPANCGFVNFYAGSLSDKIMISDSSDLTYEEYNRDYYLKKKPNENILDYIANNIPRNTSKSNYKILNIGDSLWGNYEGNDSLSGIIHNLTGATTYNCGFGGCRMTQRPNDGGWNAFSMCNLADSIAAGDFTMQDNAISTGFIDMLDYFPSHLNTLKSIDFSEIDILTIGFGINDYMGGKYVENINNKYDKDYINGALRYSIETIQTAYPNLCIVVVSPNFAVWFQNGQVWKTSDEPYYNASTGVTLPDVVNGLKTVANEYHNKFINVYDNSGNNKFTALNNFNLTDGVHPNENGRLKMGTYIANNLLDQ